MVRASSVLASLVLLFGPAPRVAAQVPKFAPCDEPPAAVSALGTKSEIAAYGISPDGSVVVAALNRDGNAAGSVLRFAKAGSAPKDVKLGGTIVGVAVAPDGARAFAIVRVTTRKGQMRSVELESVDLGTARVTGGPTIPVTSRGLAIGDGGSTLLIASRDEIRTFQLPALSSGPLYRALGDNVGVAPIPGSTFVLLAQPSRVVLADLAGSQGRDGLTLSQEVASPSPLQGMLASAGERSPVAVSDDGRGWCVSAAAPMPPPPPPPPEAPVAPPSEPVRETTAPPEAPQPPEPSTAQTESTPNTEPAPGSRTEPSTAFGRVEGPAVTEVGAVVFLGPDNVLREAARAVPNGSGNFVSPGLAPGAYRVVAAGKEGRVLICEPPFITVRVDSESAVELPVLKVIRAQ